MSKKDFQNGFALGLASGGVVEIEKEEQEKTVDITENGETVITPDDENTTLSKVTVNVDVPMKEEQEKVIDITSNGTTEVTPDEGMALSKVTVNVAVESGGGEDTLRAWLLNTLTEININDEIQFGSKRLYCSSLVKFSAPNLSGACGGFVFYGCGRLRYIDIGKATSLDINAIGGLHSIETIIMRKSDAVVSLNNKFVNNQSITKEDYDYFCYFYVPKALIEDYKVATNWSNYANRFRAIEDYPEITGGVI